MKPTLLTTLSILLFALTTYFPLAFTQDIEKVKDTNGNPLVPGAKYYIWQTTTSGQKGGGLMLGLSGGTITPCPLTVIQEFCGDDIDDGSPVIFNVTDGGDVILEDLSNVEIEFDKKPDCAQSSKWVMVQNEDYFHTTWISIGSFQDPSDDIQIINGVFKIKKQGLGYKLVFFSKGTYFDIKRFNDVLGRRLVTEDTIIDPYHYHPFEVKFVNANRYRRSVV
ncbi:hypothetical protein TSUD_294240 [Trifolium subterraneum]|uniref:Uncharacterized protein n=1 Tax=Trifolium subterraneum TaxID=3900 RepID=A0A2Z6M5E7_TRISU|nr:hypothetical protein TSUD_294240 [Trifolium subterraneum]